MQSFFASLFVALLLRTSFLVAVGGAEPVWDQEHGTEGMDPMRYVRLPGRGAGDHAAGPPAEHRPEFSPRHLVSSSRQRPEPVPHASVQHVLEGVLENAV